jgi:large subunit ribosomal protein L25
MKSLLVKGQLRPSLGKKEAKKIRSQESVPAVLYGSNEIIHFSISFAELRPLVYTPDVYLVTLDIDGTNYPAIMQDIQWHAVEEQAMHIDFLRVEDNKPVKVDLPVKILGVAKGTKTGGKLKINLRRLKVKGIAKNLPDTIDINVTKLGIGQSVKVADLKMENVEFLDTKSNVVVAVTITRAARSAAGAAAAVADDDEDEAGEE